MHIINSIGIVYHHAERVYHHTKYAYHHTQCVYLRDVAQLVVARQKQLSVVFDEAKPPKARRRQSRRLAKAIVDDYATVAFSPLGRADGL